MKKLLALLFLLAAGTCAWAQNFTTVTGTVLDPNGIPFAGGTITFVLGPLPFSSPPTLPTTPATPVSGTIGPVGLDNNGKFSATLPSNAAITPGSTQWTPSVCLPQTASNVLENPVTTNCFTAAAITISGSSQDISTTVNASAFAVLQRANVGRLYSTLPAAGNSSITATTMVTAPAQPSAGTSYRLSAYVSQTVLGTSCAGNSTISLNAVFQDPNAAAPQTQAVATFTVTTNGTLGIVPITSTTDTMPLVLRAKAGTVVQFSTNYSPGGSCAPAPTVQVYPILEQM